MDEAPLGSQPAGQALSKREPSGAPNYQKNKMSTELTQARLKELLHYDPDSGVFTWRVTVGPRGHAGSVAGSLTQEGYWKIQISRSPYQSHRLAVLYMTGEWPEADVDHRDGVRINNAWSNLRLCTRGENQQNLGSQVRVSATGLRGARYCPKMNRPNPYSACISVGRVKHRLGYFPTAEEAHKAYLNAKFHLHTFNPVPRSDHATC